MTSREVGCDIRLSVARPADLVFAVAAASAYDVTESLAVTVDGVAVDTAELVAPYGTRLHRVHAPAGDLHLHYEAVVPGAASPWSPEPLDDVVFARPSRYADSDKLVPVTRSLFDGAGPDMDTVRRVRQWVLTNIRYAPGATDPLDGALDTYVKRMGVCRDTSHLVVAFLRALGIPARVVAAYAPGLEPMDFHAVAEALVEGRWWVIDGTGMARRPGLVRIATGRDAADTAFLTVQSGVADLVDVHVRAEMDPPPHDDGEMPVLLQ